MANKTEEVVTTTTKVAANGKKTVTTTTTTTTTTTRRKSDGWWGNLSTIAKVLLIAAACLIVGLLVALFLFGRAKASSDSMAPQIAKGNTVFFNRRATPERGDVLVFRHPEADSVLLSAPDKNYYKMCRLYGEAWCNKKVDPVTYQGKQKRPILLSRCIGTPGDVIAIKDNIVSVNKESVQDPQNAKHLFMVIASRLLSNEVLEPLGLHKDDIAYTGENAETIISFYHKSIPTGYQAALYSLSETTADALVKSDIVSKVQRVTLPKEYYERTVFPYIEKLHWNSSNFGPVLVPQKGKVLKLNANILPLYRRCIEAYEKNKVEVKGNTIYINGAEATSYRFQRDYYFVLGDNRSSEDDSRYFGFVPENYIMGVAHE
ncbi:MAG: signal peptidase I [Bacteroidales bacterium]|nr:signal peptidase I [Bacteroidales bacterium]